MEPSESKVGDVNATDSKATDSLPISLTDSKTSQNSNSSNPSNQVLDSCTEFFKHSKYITLNQSKINNVARIFFKKKSMGKAQSWARSPCHPQVRNCDPEIFSMLQNAYAPYPVTWEECIVDWIFLLDMLNFSFWSDTPAELFACNFDGKVWTGYYSWCAVVFRAIKEYKLPLSCPKYYSKLSQKDFDRIFHSDSEKPMPMLKERLEIMHDHGKILVENYKGTFSTIVKASKMSSQALISTVVKNFFSFVDYSSWESPSKVKTNVYFYKRAQILVADLWACFNNTSFGKFNDIDSVTAFADYRVPQGLHDLGCFDYSPELVSILLKQNENNLLKSGDRIEMEIRAATIVAIQKIIDHIHSINPNHSANAILVDFFLWNYAKRQNVSKSPIHKIRCIYY